MMTGLPIVSSGNGALVSGYTVPDRVATHLFPTILGMVHRTVEVIRDPFSLAALGPGAGDEALAIQFTAVHLEGRRPDEAVQTARSTIHPLFAERALLFLQVEVQVQAQARGDPPALLDRRDNNRR